jgi:glycosyltransferase involved in cell wall biosynthesis
MTDAFRQKGYRTLLLAGEVPTGEGSMEYLARERNIVPIRIGTLSRRISWHKDLATLLQLVRILHRERPLVLHTHTAKAGTLGRLAAIATRVPVRVHTFHGHVFRGYFSPLVTRAFLAVERFLARHTDRIIAISDSQKQELAEVYRIAPAEKISVIPLGFDLGPFLAVDGPDGALRESLGCSSGTFLVGWVGRLTAIKDPGLFLSAARLLIGSARDFRFALIGDGELRQHCEDQIQAYDLGQVVSLTGWRQKLNRIYADLDLVVLTSINEGTPVALLEAMASGKAFVATDVGGVRDLMVGSAQKQSGFEVFENGILVPRVSERLAQAVTYLRERPELREAMGRTGRSFVTARFSSQRLADDLEALYLSLARAKGALPSKEAPLVSGDFLDPSYSSAPRKVL